jgi:hypothetical protein
LSRETVGWVDAACGIFKIVVAQKPLPFEPFTAWGKLLFQQPAREETS